jgi:hypothetical protein
MRFLMMLLIVFIPLTSYAGVYKCIKDHKVVFQDVECGLDTKVFGTAQQVKESKPQQSSTTCMQKGACVDKMNRPQKSVERASDLIEDISVHTAMKSLPENATIYLCYSGGKDLLFMEVPCFGPEKSANVWIEKAEGWGQVIPKLPRRNVDISIMGVSPQEIDSLADTEKKVQMPESMKHKVKSFNKLTGRYKVTKISAYQGVFYKHTAEMCLKDFYFNHEDLIKYGAYIAPSQCSFSDFKTVGNTVSYKKQCTEQGKKASMIVSISRNGLSGKFEQKALDVAPSSEIGDDYFLEVVYSGFCVN